MYNFKKKLILSENTIKLIQDDKTFTVTVKEIHDQLYI